MSEIYKACQQVQAWYLERRCFLMNVDGFCEAKTTLPKDISYSLCGEASTELEASIELEKTITKDCASSKERYEARDEGFFSCQGVGPVTVERRLTGIWKFWALLTE